MWIQKLKYLWGNYVRHFWVSVGRGSWLGARGSWVGRRGAWVVGRGERGDEAWVWKRLHGGAECGAGEAVDKRVSPMG